MTSDPDEALTWDGDDDTAASPPADAALPGGWHAVGKGSEAVGRVDEDGTITPAASAESSALSTTMLLTLGVIGGIYLLFSIGWVVGGLRLKPLANLIVTDAMYLPWFVLAVAAPALWFLAGWVLTRGKASWMRVGVLLLGIVLLVPWPFVTLGVIGS